MKYIDRDGKVTIQDSNQDRLLGWMYTHCLGRGILKVLVCPAISKAGGWLLGRRWSACLVAPFVKANKIDLSCYEKQEYASYNEFFTRRMKPGLRPLACGEQTLISPCDGKLSVYPITSGKKGESLFHIKNTAYTVKSLLRSEALAKCYDGGMACVFRLTVDDYHRYCYIDEGKKSGNIHIPGIFHTVNPVANDVVPVYKENTREYSLLKSRHFKTVLMMEVGALMVGRITNYHGRQAVRRGQEKGRFEFGGSTVILLFQKDAVSIDKQILRNTQCGYETTVKMGEKIGEACQDGVGRGCIRA